MNRDNIQKDWSDSLRDKLQSAEVQPSAALFQRLEQSLAQQPKRPNRLIALSRTLTAAAAVLVVGLIASHLIFSHKVDIMELEPIATYASSSELSETIEPDNQLTEVFEPQQKTLAHNHTTKQNISQPIVQPTTPNKETESKTAPAAKTEEVEVASNNTPEPIAKQTSEPTTTKEFVPQKRKRAATTLALTGSISNGASTTAPAISSIATGLLQQSAFTRVSTLAQFNDSDITHFQPLSVGAIFSYGLTENLSLESGLQYTLLRSQANLSYNNRPIVQNVHYLGVPLKLRYEIFSNRNFSIYSSAGGAVERCVKAEIDGEYIEQRRWQYSANASLGVQYKFSPLVALYVEPDLGYYFPQGNLRTIRSESPLSFTARAGLRFSL